MAFSFVLNSTSGNQSGKSFIKASQIRTAPIYNHQFNNEQSPMLNTSKHLPTLMYWQKDLLLPGKQTNQKRKRHARTMIH